MNIYVGNLEYGCSEEDLEGVFGAHGEIASVKIIRDRETGRAKGFGFVEMADDASAESAIEALDGADLRGRPLKVNQARPPQKREFTPRY